MAEENEVKFTKEGAIKTIAELKEQVAELTEAKTIEVIKEVDVIEEVVISNSDIGGNIGALAGALALTQSEFEAIKKDTEGYGYNYADIAAILKYVQPIYTKNGLSIIQLNVSKMLGKTPLIGVRTVLAHKDGGYMSSEIYIPTMKTKLNTTVQVAGVHITYLRRYGIQSILGLATTDNDGRDDDK